jgi:hydroxyacylglutathione hydrolase
MSQALSFRRATTIADVAQAAGVSRMTIVVDAENIPLDYINENMAQIDKNKTYYVHCAGGYRSMIFNSIMKARGYDNLIDVKGGLSAIKASAKFGLTDYVCPTTLL